MIDVEMDVKPEGWMDDEPNMIPDPSIEKPEEWSDEDDGEFVAPMIENPKCSVGCGEWKPRKIHNPLFRGIWVHISTNHLNVDCSSHRQPRVQGRLGT